MGYTYTDCLAFFGVGGAHPGGLYVTERTLKKEEMTKDSLVLDLGCGTGQTAAFLAEKFGCKVTGIDSHPLMVQKARKRCESIPHLVDVKKGRAERLPFSDVEFDFVLSESVLSFTNLSESLAEIGRVLKRTGKLIAVEAVVEEDDIDLEQLKNFYGFTNLLTEREWVHLFRGAGFKQAQTWNNREGALPSTSIESAPDFSPSPDIDEELYMLLEKHEQLTHEYRNVLSYRVFRCSFEE